MPKSRFFVSAPGVPAPGRVFLPGCALAAGLLLVAPIAWAAPDAPATSQPAMKLSVGKTATYPLPARSSYVIETGALNVLSESKNGTLSIKALRAGVVRLRLRTPDQPTRLISLELVDSGIAAPTSQSFGGQTLLPASSAPTTTAISIPPIALDAPKVVRRASSQVIDRAPNAGAAPQRAPLAGAPASATPPVNLGPIPAAGTSGAPAAAPAANPFQLFPPDFGGPSVPTTAQQPLSASPLSASPLSASPTSEFPANPLPPQNFPPASTTPRVQLTPQTRPQNQPAQQQIPRLPAPPATNNSAPDTIVNPTINNPTITLPAMNNSGGATISPSLPAPAQSVNPNVTYKTTPNLPASYNQLKAKQSVAVMQGEARLLTFQNNILSVFFSDPNVMDARAINARTIAVTGTGAGSSTLAVFTERYPGDAVGFASVYRVDTQARGSGLPIIVPDAATVEAALTTALADPRIRVSVVKLPEGTLAARLTGIVRDAAEVQGAITTASFFVTRVLPSIYADPNVPSIDAVLSGAVTQTPSDQLQDNLRRITGNNSIELISMPGSLVLKAEADSQGDAQRLLELLPTLNQAVIPFVTIRGGGRVESSNVPLLQGEDLQLTQKLQAVTGVRTVYAVRASGNSIAIYGTVQDRSEYQAVKRYGNIIAQSSAPASQPGAAQGGSVFRPQGLEPALAAYDPTGGYQRQLGVQMFVRIIDPTEAVVRNVTIETNIVEITRTNLRNLGAEYGSATLTGESITAGTPGTSTPVVDGNGNPVIGANGNPLFNTTPGTPGVTTRTIDPTFNPGTQVLGNSFAGFGGFGALNPFRTRINALAQNNNARGSPSSKGHCVTPKNLHTGLITGLIRELRCNILWK